jgi:hypothetical protein
LPQSRLRAMLMAGAEVLECQRALARGGINLVSEMLRGEGEFIEYEHYPRNDVYDAESGGQYYYHSHRGVMGEHGHFHTFMRHRGVTAASTPASDGDAETGPQTTHLIAISMDAYGWPTGLFATNRWVTGELWHPADTVLDMVRRFRIDHASPSWPVNRWISAMLVLYHPHIEALLVHRDYVLAEWARAHPDREVFEDRELEMTGFLPVSVEDLVCELRKLAASTRRAG